MKAYLALGANLGDRAAALEHAAGALGGEGVAVRRASPVVESPALLPAGAPADWNRPFLNCVVEAETALTPTALLEALKRIETGMGRAPAERWAPRPIDVDILLYGQERIETERLTVPHAGLAERPFFLTPLAALAPRLVVPGDGRTVLELSRALGRNIPLWMGIVNVTPDSFSDGGRYLSASALETLLDGMDAGGVHIVDLGAESTRPGATPLAAEAEWARLEAPLAAVLERYAGRLLRPRVSVDTYHAPVAARAIELGADLVNDVSGLTSDAMLEIARGSRHVDFVAMHNLSIPADRAYTLPADADPIAELNRWLAAQRERWHRAGIDDQRIVFDPGIGFGKDPLQSLEILRRIDELELGGLRLLVGHSRKSFMGAFASGAEAERDLVTVGASLELAARGVDILRVHDVPAHAAAYRGWAHLR